MVKTWGRMKRPARRVPKRTSAVKPFYVVVGVRWVEEEEEEGQSMHLRDECIHNNKIKLSLLLRIVAEEHFHTANSSVHFHCYRQHLPPPPSTCTHRHDHCSSAVFFFLNF
jgi:hypothetical protein